MALALRREGSLVFRALSRHETTALTALKAETRDDTKKEDATTQRQSRLDRQPRQKDDSYDSSPQFEKWFILQRVWFYHGLPLQKNKPRLLPSPRSSPTCSCRTTHHRTAHVHADIADLGLATEIE